MDELADVRAEELVDGAGYAADDNFSHRLVSRRMLEVYNSSGRDIARLTRKYSYNPAFMNPLDCRGLGLKSGDVVEIASERAAILGIVEEADDVASGVISMAHAWGDVPEEDGKVRTIGSHTGRLISNESAFDSWTGIPRMSAIPVIVRKLEEPAVV